MNAERQKFLQAEITRLESVVEVIDFEFRGGSELDEERCTERYNAWEENNRLLRAMRAEMAAYIGAVQAAANEAVDAVAEPREWTSDADWRARFAAARRTAAEKVAEAVIDSQERDWIVALATDSLRSSSPSPTHAGVDEREYLRSKMGEIANLIVALSWERDNPEIAARYAALKQEYDALSAVVYPNG